MKKRGESGIVGKKEGRKGERKVGKEGRKEQRKRKVGRVRK